MPAIHVPNSCTKKSYDLHVMYQKFMVQGCKCERRHNPVNLTTATMLARSMLSYYYVVYQQFMVQKCKSRFLLSVNMSAKLFEWQNSFFEQRQQYSVLTKRIATDFFTLNTVNINQKYLHLDESGTF